MKAGGSKHIKVGKGVTNVQVILHWLVQHPLAVASLVYCGAIFGITAYAYLFKYKILTTGL
jgi:hypothetical protein